jgi:hypothetical protein
LLSMTTVKHGATQYRNGCRCAVCRGAEAARQRRRRASNPNAHIRTPRANVIALPQTQQPTQPGDVETAVRGQLAGNPRADDRPGEAAAAIRLAQLLDRDDHSALAAQMTYRLHTVLNSLGAPKRKSGSRLAVVQAMVARR